MKALALHSGGLDSTLAIRLILDQGIEVQSLHFVSVFDCGMEERDSCRAARLSAEQLGVPARYENFSDDLLRLVKNPPHGHGRHMNPCIDCHARMMQRAAALMPEVGASFLISGEVLGERPMSQRREALGIVEREAGVEGLLLRPLCAKLLDPTVPEQKGWVDRERLLGISGRCRKPQLDLAKKCGITKFPTPAGGCLLTDPGFALRMKDLLTVNPACTPEDVRLLKVGRHFRIEPAGRLAMGRNEGENTWIERLGSEGDLLMEAADVPGPVALLRGGKVGGVCAEKAQAVVGARHALPLRSDAAHIAPDPEEAIALAASLTAHYGKGGSQAVVRVRLRVPGSEEARFLEVAPAAQELVERLRIGASTPDSGGDRGRE